MIIQFISSKNYKANMNIKNKILVKKKDIYKSEYKRAKKIFDKNYMIKKKSVQCQVSAQCKFLLSQKSFLNC